MLFKLYKYDMKSIIRLILPVWILAPVLSIFFGFACMSSEREYFESEAGTAEYFIGDTILPIILGLALFAVFVAIAVITILFVVLRFWRGLLGDEGYLMHTLPVRDSNLIISKVISSLTVGVLSVIDAVISITCILAVFNGGFFAIKDVAGIFLDKINESLGNVSTWFIVLLVVVLIFDIIANIYQIYASMAIGQIFGRHRIAASVIAYMAIEILLNTISGFWLMITAIIGFNSDVNKAIFSFTNPNSILVGLILSLICAIVLTIAYHVVIMYIFRRKLNLV